jgi:hypothetical protein
MILSRKPYLSSEGNTMLLNILENIKFHSNYLVETMFDIPTCKSYKNQNSIFIPFLLFFSITKKIFLN